MTLICKPRGRGNWKLWRFTTEGQPDMTLIGKVIQIVIPGVEHQHYWVRGVEP